jgi:hypothetical protein
MTSTSERNGSESDVDSITKPPYHQDIEPVDRLGSDIDPGVFPSTAPHFIYILLHSYIIVHGLIGCVHVLLPSSIALYTEFHPLPTNFRSQGIIILTFASLSTGIIRSLQAHVDMQSLFIFSISFHCTMALSNLLWMGLTGVRGFDAYDGVWVIFNACWLLGLVSYQKGRLLGYIQFG